MDRMLGFVVIVILYAVIRFMVAAGAIFIARKILAPKAEQIFYAMFLIMIAAFYLAFAAYFGVATGWRLETAIVVAFVAIALPGARLPFALIAAGRWTVGNTDPAVPKAGALHLYCGAVETRIFFAANDRASVQLEINALVESDDTDAIVIHSTSQVAKMARSPLAAPGRTGRAGLRHVGMAELTREATSFDHLSERFRKEAVL